MSDRTLRGSSRYLVAAGARESEGRVKSQVEKLIDRANTEISVFDVLRDSFGLNLPRDGESFKSRCPFGDEHDDGGLDKNFRTYPASNHAYCFAMHGVLTPVRLIALKNRWLSGRSASYLLDSYGLLRPKNYRDRWASVAMEMETEREQIGNPQFAVEALTAYLRTTETYIARQFDTDVLSAMESVLEELDKASTSGDPSRLRQWFDQAKVRMTETLGETK